ncbi:DMT family transporter [Pelodictyon luteolum]|uniref:SMR drug efflux transporter n=1 Tax=Chlorobium luteolum (strain DSM 273 / BCRC 81028 / 2530) TaxID=319225 RepID=Q3B2U6_CHLL3|nr:multidrug efflux SMR transporter [Pelodictyon luteolum]ABB24335.1 SMR drug efflux transporter [Pelodictyon luteolum DSM 273]
MHWIALFMAIATEVAGTTCLKFSDGFTKLVPSVFVFIFYTLSFTLLGQALKVLPIGMSYAIWAGLGTALVSMIGVIWFAEAINPVKIISLGLIIIGVAGLHLSQQHAV